VNELEFVAICVKAGGRAVIPWAFFLIIIPVPPRVMAQAKGDEGRNKTVRPLLEDFSRGDIRSFMQKTANIYTCLFRIQCRIENRNGVLSH